MGDLARENRSESKWLCNSEVKSLLSGPPWKGSFSSPIVGVRPSTGKKSFVRP